MLTKRARWTMRFSHKSLSARPVNKSVNSGQQLAIACLRQLRCAEAVIDSVEEPTGGAQTGFKKAPVTSFSRRECYWHRTPKGLLRIVESLERPSRWELYL